MQVKLVSFTGSTKIGKIVQANVNNRFGKCILELGGNNASIIMADANLDLAIKGSLFGAVGTCGQRCTSLRRLLIQEQVFEEVKSKLVKVYPTIAIGNPTEPGN
jgi:aldehyde dehydrogenase (NAD+)